MSSVTWKKIARAYPEFVQWVVQTYGPVGDGEVDPEHYQRMVRAYNNYIEERKERSGAIE